ncbi:class I SAM-dependent methyltransferase [Bacillus sp. Marseille-P3661]|uniref:class I SAM-dependent methyltransferase n=1 Tax=Bacillus sp. Marseille-P3661 TaxID=1936234 RepID=UPI002155E2F7|nr:SAM-dependent methyltransferase [Bacillus sp. Marseille-P3661]
MIVKLIRESPNFSISYAQYMEMALYHPVNGYYMKDRAKIGKSGDFYTTSNVHAVFGKLLCRVFAQLVEKNYLPPVICEIGAGTGKLANSIIEEWKNNFPDSFNEMEYLIVESSPYHLAQQKEQIKCINKVQQYETISALIDQRSKLTGIMFSNELFDAFPVHVVQQVQGEINEVRISLDSQQNLIEVFEVCSNDEILNWLKQSGLQIPEGHRIEIPLAMTKWIYETKHWFDKGIMFTIDYGYTNDEVVKGYHSEGSLRGYFQHQLIKNPLLHSGEMDLTTHVHLDAIIKIGEKVGLEYVKMLKQNQFLYRAGIMQYLQDTYDPNPFSEISKQNRAIRTLLSDTDISSSFTVIIQQKKLDLSITDILTYDAFN